MSNNNYYHAYYATTIGFIAFCAFLVFSIRSCAEKHMADNKEQYKIEQLKIQLEIKKLDHMPNCKNK